MRPILPKTFFPASFYGRAVLILIMPVIVIQIVLSVVFIQRHYERVTTQMTTNVLRDIRFLTDRINAADAPEIVLADLSDLIDALDIGITTPADPAPYSESQVERFDLAGHEILRVLESRLPGFLVADLKHHRGEVRIWLDSQHGLLRIDLSRQLVAATNPHQLLVIVFLASVLMTLIAFQFLRLQIRPIRRLGAAAEAYGRGETVPFRASGAREMRAAGHAFLDMRNRIERQRAQQRVMLSGVSHDMRTPLTRMRLILSMMEESEDRSALEAEIADLESRLDGFLDFTRGQIAEPVTEVDLTQLVEGLVERYRTVGHAIEFRPCSTPVPPLPLQSGQITRALDNLISNALRHAQQVEVSLICGYNSIEITVEDDGPGIAPEHRAVAVEPFTRLDDARNAASGGVGLGLAIASEVMRAHGGTLSLAHSQRLGGLRAVLHLDLRPRRLG